MEKNNPIIATFGNRNFEVAIWTTGEPGQHRAFIRAREGGAVLLFDGGLECSEAALCDLLRLVSTAREMIRALNSGVTVKNWSSGLDTAAPDPSCN